jgi:glycosyltransferase involved in cell wall biosynthesis
VLDTDILARVAERWEQPWLSRAALEAGVSDLALVRRLRRVRGLLHLTNHHLGRHALFLRQPYVITVHDLIRLFDLRGRQPPLIHEPNRRARFYLGLDYAGIKRASRIIAVSQTTARDLSDHLDLDPRRIDIVYEGVDLDVYRPVDRTLRDRPYVLFVGSEQPRKNLIGLLRAFALLKKRRGMSDLELVKVGGEGFPRGLFRPETLAMIHRLGLERDVFLPGWVEEEDLVAYYSGAICCVLPSFYEGFGFPVAEAMACGCPVVTTKATATGEIGGDAVRYVDPESPESISEAIAEIANSPVEQARLAEAGRRRAARFSWDRTAAATLAVYERAQAHDGYFSRDGDDPSRVARESRFGAKTGAR